MRILQGCVAMNTNEVTPHLGGLYCYPYPVILRNEEKNDVVKDLESYDLFVVLEVIRKVSGNYLKVLTTTGEIGVTLYSPRYLKMHYE